MENKALLWAMPTKSGYLMKQGGDVKSWKRRFFVLKDSSLFYFKGRPDDSEPVGMIPLVGCDVRQGPAVKDKEFTFTVVVPQEPGVPSAVKRPEYLLAASEADDGEIWIEAIRSSAMPTNTLFSLVQAKREETRDLEQRMLVATARDSGKPLAYAPQIAGDEMKRADVVVVAEDLLATRQAFVLASQRAGVEQQRYADVAAKLSKLQATTAMQEQGIMQNPMLAGQVPAIQADMESCKAILDWIIPSQGILRTLRNQLEALTGVESINDEVPSDAELEAMLEGAIAYLDSNQSEGPEEMVDDSRITLLEESVALIHAQAFGL